MSKFPEPKIIGRYPIPSVGTTHKYIEIVKCPECGHEYNRAVSSGCFHHSYIPITCPKCGYPYKQLREEVYKHKTNPSRRDALK